MSVSSDTSMTEDLSAIYQGGENFLARMKALTDQRAAIDNMLKELRLGRSAREAYDEADKSRSDASAALSSAKDQASSIVKNAQDFATKTKSEADSYAKTLMENAEAARVEAVAIRDEANKLRASADEVHNKKEDFLKEVGQARADAEAAIARSQAVMAILSDAIDKAMKLK